MVIESTTVKVAKSLASNPEAKFGNISYQPEFEQIFLIFIPVRSLHHKKVKKAQNMKQDMILEVV